ncbi:MAG: 2-oxoacid:acceptor oxidoreductase subunit alpha, partial [Bacillota bacterium]
MGKMQRHRAVYEWVEPWKTDDSELLVLTFGSPARAARSAIRQAREEGMKVGELRLITIWPFPEEILRESLQGVTAVIVPEMNLGQLRLEVERVVAGRTPVVGLNRTDGELFKPEEIYQKIREVYDGE